MKGQVLDSSRSLEDVHFDVDQKRIGLGNIRRLRKGLLKAVKMLG